MQCIHSHYGKPTDIKDIILTLVMTIKVVFLRKLKSKRFHISFETISRQVLMLKTLIKKIL